MFNSDDPGLAGALTYSSEIRLRDIGKPVVPVPPFGNLVAFLYGFALAPITMIARTISIVFFYHVRSRDAYESRVAVCMIISSVFASSIAVIASRHRRIMHRF